VTKPATVRSLLLYAVLPLALMAERYAGWLKTAVIGEDFKGGVWQAGQHVLVGQSPYPHLPLGPVLTGHVPFVYPPTVLLFGAPFSALPLSLAAGLWMLLLAASAAATLWILDLRDWRCYALMMLSMPVVEGVILGNITLLLAPAIALAWRWRDRPLPAALVVGFAIALKPFFWPLCVWLFVTGRRRTAAVAAAVALAALLVSWAAIGFAGLREYPALLSAVSRKTATESYSLLSLATGLGLSRTLGQALEYSIGLAVLAAGALVARHRDGDRKALSLTLIAMLCLTPLVHRHYFVLLFIVIALRDKEITTAWLIPVAFLFRPLLPIHPPVLNGVPYQRDPVDVGSLLVLAALTLLVLKEGPIWRRGPRAGSPSAAALETA
jgi:hypothetical protein